MTRWWKTGGLCVALLLVGTAPPAGAQRAPLRGLDAYVEAAMREWEVPGLAIAVVKDDSVVFARGYGVRELGEPERVDAHTVFAIASITKSFTAASVGMLVDEGKVRWDDPVTEHLPGFALGDAWVTSHFTVRDLLSHHAGVERGDWIWFGTDYDRDEVVRHLRYLRPSGDFRTTYGYSNNMFIAAGQLVAAVSGRSWDEFVAERIFAPLGMTRSNTSVVGLASMDNVAIPHEKIGGRVRTVPHGNLDNEGPGGSINSSVAQMAQWMRLQLSGGTIDGRRLLEAATLREMHSPQTIIRFGEDEAAAYPGVDFMAYGFGWQIQDYRGRKLVQHGGAFDGMRSQLALIPEERLGVVILSNRGRGNTLFAALRNRVLDAYLGAPARDWSAEYLARARRAEARADSAEKEWDAKRVTGTKPSWPLERYVGTYVDSAYGAATVRLDGKELVVRLGPRHSGKLEHWHFDTFIATWENPLWGRSAITFPIDAEGEITELVVRGLRSYRRVDEPAR